MGHLTGEIQAGMGQHIREIFWRIWITLERSDLHCCQLLKKNR